MSWSKTNTLNIVSTLFALLSCVSVPVRGQEFSNEFSNKVRIVPAPVEPEPFATTRVRRDPSYSVKFENADRLTPGDRLLVANAESAISDLATSAGLGYRDKGW